MTSRKDMTPAKSLTPAVQRRASLGVGGDDISRRTASLSHIDASSSAASYGRSSSTQFVVPFASVRPVPGQEKAVMNAVPESQWVPDDMTNECCLCREEFNLIKRRHHCRSCGRLVCDDCSHHRVKGDRTCSSCWDRLGRKMSGIGLTGAQDASKALTPRGRGRGVRRSALAELLEEERFNREFVLADGRKVSYSVAGVSDGLPVFLFLGLDSHRHSAAHFEDPARRRGLRLICIDRPGRGRSDSVPCPKKPVVEDATDSSGMMGAGKEGGAGGGGSSSDAEMCEAVEKAVVDIVKQMCLKLRLDKAAVVGQSLGAVFALRCAREPDLKLTLDDTTVCLVSPWVPLAAEGSNGVLQGLSKSEVMKGALDTKSTMSKMAADLAVKTVSEMALWKNSSGASEIEKGYLEAPYTQELIRHVTELKESRSSMVNEVSIALRNQDAAQVRARFATTLHPVKIWHGRSDKLVPYGAMKWLEAALPTCETTVKLGGTHALMYDKQEMEGVFADLQRSMTEAKSKARFSARRLTTSLSYVASDVMSLASASPAVVAAAGPSPNVAGGVSPRSGKKENSTDASSTTPSTASASESASKEPPDPVNLRDKFRHAISTVIENSNNRSKANSDAGSTHDGSAHGSTTSSGHGISGLFLGGDASGSAHDGSVNGSGHGNLGGGSCGGAGMNQRRASISGSAGGSMHSAVGIGSLHGSAIPEDGPMDWGSGHAATILGGEGETEGGTSGSFLGDLGMHINRALSAATAGSEQGSISSTGGDEGAAAAAGRSGPVASDASMDSHSYRAPSDADHEPEGESSGFLTQMGRMVSLSLTGGNSEHGSTLGENAGAGSGHGSAMLGVDGGGSSAGGSGHGSVAGTGPGSGRKPSSLFLPWSQHSEENANDGSRNVATPRAEVAAPVSHHGSDVDDGNVFDGMKKGVERALSTMGIRNIPSPATNDTQSVYSYSNSLHDPGVLSASHHSGSETRGAAMGSGITQRAGYAAAMANWPAGKVEGEPAWEEWSDEKKLMAHFITALCLALIVATF